MKRKTFFKKHIKWVACLGVGLLAPLALAAEGTVYKSPTCGCCQAWVDYMERNGFELTIKEHHDVQRYKRLFGVPGQVASCHTAVIDGYVIEGHVPVEDVRRLLAERPDVRGLAVPGMPMGSPGMEGPRKDAYETVTFTRNGQVATFAQH